MTNGKINKNHINQPLNQQKWTNKTTEQTCKDLIKGYDSNDNAILTQTVNTTILPRFWTNTTADLEYFTIITPCTQIKQNLVGEDNQRQDGVQLIKYPCSQARQGMINFTHTCLKDYYNKDVRLHILLRKGLYFKVGFFNKTDEVIEVTGEEDETTITELCYDFKTMTLYIDGVKTRQTLNKTTDDIHFIFNDQGLIIYDIYLDSKQTLQPQPQTDTGFQPYTINTEEGSYIVRYKGSYIDIDLDGYVTGEEGEEMGTKQLTLEQEYIDHTWGNEIIYVFNVHDGFLYYKEDHQPENRLVAIPMSHYNRVDLSLVTSYGWEYASVQYTPLLVNYPYDKIASGDVFIDDIYDATVKYEYPPHEGIKIVLARNDYYAYQFPTRIDVLTNQEITISARGGIPLELIFGLGYLGGSVTDEDSMEDWIIGPWDETANYDDFTQSEFEKHDYTFRIEDGIITLYRDGVQVEDYGDFGEYVPSEDEELYLCLVVYESVKGLLDLNVTHKYNPKWMQEE